MFFNDCIDVIAACAFVKMRGIRQSTHRVYDKCPTRSECKNRQVGTKFDAVAAISRERIDADVIDRRGKMAEQRAPVGTLPRPGNPIRGACSAIRRNRAACCRRSQCRLFDGAAQRDVSLSGLGETPQFGAKTSNSSRSIGSPTVAPSRRQSSRWIARSGLIRMRRAIGESRLVTSVSWLPLAAPLLNALALVLALAFRRNRAVLALIVLTLVAAALSSAVDPIEPSRPQSAMRMFAPWLLLVIAAMPERGLLAIRNLIVFLAIALAVWLTIAAPVASWSRLSALLPFGVLPWSAGAIAAALTFTGACICVVRWILRGTPIEGGLAIVLACAGIALLPIARVDVSRTALLAAGATAVIAVVYSSYRMAFIDALSGLPNRRALDETLTRLSGAYAIAMVDIDHFKKFNDAHGHDSGDRVLKTVAQSLRRTHGAQAFRYGGEEFCLLFTGARSRTASESCETTRDKIENERVRIRSVPTSRQRVQAVKRNALSDVRVTVSIGIAERDAQTRAPQDVLKNADQALYRAKTKGRNRVVKA